VGMKRERTGIGQKKKKEGAGCAASKERRSNIFLPKSKK
jgi:hypothetical protein